MTQQYGRHSGPRGDGKRQSRQPAKATPPRDKKPYARVPPARDPAQTASIFKTRSFKWLVEVVGAENIALGLDSNLTRVAELINGERFTPETAFHMETTLGLPDGFFDRPNPALTAETIDRLKAPLDFISANARIESSSAEESDATAAAQMTAQSAHTNHLHRKSEMRKKTGAISQHDVTESKPAGARNAKPTPSKPAQANARASIKPVGQQPLPLSDTTSLQNIRRANLHALTSRKGSKARLATVMGISTSNLDNRLYGQKRLDDAEASRFTDRLGLPSAWLDVPRSISDIPEPVSALLDPVMGRTTANATEVAIAVEPEPTAAKSPARKQAKTASQRHDKPAKFDRISSPTATKEVTAHQEPFAPPAADLSVVPPVQNDAPMPVDLVHPTPAIAKEVLGEPRRSAVVTSLDDLIGIAPIAEALIKTLAGKARTGRLDEMKALELLQQIVLL